MAYHNQLSLGSIEQEHRNVLMPLFFGDPEADKFVEDLNEIFKYRVVEVIPEVARRPDLISNLWYGSVKYDWLILLVNGISDPFEGLAAGTLIRLPII